jgi:uncharacterized protein
MIMNKKYKIILIIPVLLLLVSIIYYKFNPLRPKVIINGHAIYVELAITGQEKERGLGYRKNLAPDNGMIFVYDHKEIYPFWMKGMNFALDFIWIDGNKIVDLSSDIPILTNNQISVIKPKVPVDKILEVNAGTISQLGIKIGDFAKFKN